MEIKDLKMTRKEQTEVLQGVSNQLDNHDRNELIFLMIDMLTANQKKELLIKCFDKFTAETAVSLTENEIICEDEE